VKPPGSIIVPEVMVRVCADADRDLGCFHDVCWGWHTRNPGKQKPPILIRKRRCMRGEILVQRITPRCTSKGTHPSATVGFLLPRLAAPVALRVPDVRSIEAKAQGPHNPLLCHKINTRDLLKKLAVRGLTNYPSPGLLNCGWTVPWSLLSSETRPTNQPETDVVVNCAECAAVTANREASAAKHAVPRLLILPILQNGVFSIIPLQREVIPSGIICCFKGSVPFRILFCFSNATANASNIRVKGECLPAHGTPIVITPHRSH
jgi:hypothetical protein